MVTKKKPTAKKKPAAKKTVAVDSKVVAKEIAAIIADAGGWKGKKVTELRAAVNKASSKLVEEVKWKMPSKPLGVPVWSHMGMLGHIDILKNAVRLNFTNGAKVKDPKKLFNARLDSGTTRAIDFAENDKVDSAYIKTLVLDAMRVNEAKAK
jgi:hypothetical protein